MPKILFLVINCRRTFIWILRGNIYLEKTISYLGCLPALFSICFRGKMKRHLRLITEIVPSFLQEGCVVVSTEVCRGTPLGGDGISGWTWQHRRFKHCLYSPHKRHHESEDIQRRKQGKINRKSSLTVPSQHQLCSCFCCSFLYELAPGWGQGWCFKSKQLLMMSQC